MPKLDDIYCFCRLPADITKFWDVNNELTYIKPFDSFYKKSGSSLIMCAIYMLYDPKSTVNNSSITTEQALLDINRNVLKDEGFNWGDYRQYIAAYKKFAVTMIEKELSLWHEELMSRADYVSGLDWDGNSAKEKEAMMAKTDTYFKKYHEIEKALRDEREEQLAYGKYTKSILESR